MTPAAIMKGAIRCVTLRRLPRGTESWPVRFCGGWSAIRGYHCCSRNETWPRFWRVNKNADGGRIPIVIFDRHMAALVHASGACSPTGELYGPHGQIAGDIFWRIAERARRARGQEQQTAAAAATAPAESTVPPRQPPHTPSTGVERWEPPSLRRSATASGSPSGGARRIASVLFHAALATRRLTPTHAPMVL